MRTLLILLLLSLVLPAMAQTRQRPAKPEERRAPPNYAEMEKFQRKLQDDLDEARDENSNIPTLKPPEVVPEGWQHDYNYASDLFDYLRRKHESAAGSNKNTYVYLYADWNESCTRFRKAASRASYKELFENNEIVMVEYVYVKRLYGAQFQLPVLLKVHRDGSLGPESVHPVGSPHDHPRKGFYKLKKFLESHDETT